MDLLDTLNSEQVKAVTFSGKHALVLAGAGTGKTKTIVSRAVYLLSKGVNPSKILILSFTRKSAREIVERIKQYQAVGGDIYLSGQTFHSWCSNIIRKNPNIFEQHAYSLMDTEDVESMFKLIFTQLYKGNKNVDQKAYGKIYKVYSYHINTRQPIKEVIKKLILDDYSKQEIKEYLENNLDMYKDVMNQYIIRKKQKKMLDYDDLLYIVAKVLKENKEIREFITSQYEHILIDEFQDTNPLQYSVLESFYENCSLFCVGDDAQSIYAFRGADFTSIHNFTKTVPNSEKLYLNMNYRSTQEILNLSNWLLEQSDIEYGKKLQAYRGCGIKPVLLFMYDDYSEANIITEKILHDYSKYDTKYSEHIVLSRSMSGLRYVEAACILKKIPYIVFGGSSLMKSKHIRDVLSVMRILSNYKDELAWNRYLQLWDKIGTITAYKMTEKIIEAPDLNNAFAILEQKIKNKNRLILDVLSQSFEYINSPPEMIDLIITLMDTRFNEIYKEEWSKWRKKDFEALKVMTQNITSISDFINEYILDPSLESSFVKSEKAKDCVILSTIHSAKGLEAKICHIVNITPYTYPSKWAVKNGDESIEEERRCLYVALTRAKDELILYSRYPSVTGSGMVYEEDDDSYYFFNDLPDDMCEIFGVKQQEEQKIYTGEPISIDTEIF